jgi:hypothetical protein
MKLFKELKVMLDMEVTAFMITMMITNSKDQKSLCLRDIGGKSSEEVMILQVRI